MNVKQELHYGKNVWTNSEMDALRKLNCLCLNCLKMENCPQAKQLYRICTDGDMALMVTRCKAFSFKQTNTRKGLNK